MQLKQLVNSDQYIFYFVNSTQLSRVSLMFALHLVFCCCKLIACISFGWWKRVNSQRFVSDFALLNTVLYFKF